MIDPPAIVRILETTEPGAPWKDTYTSTAQAMLERATLEPIFCTGSPCVATEDDLWRTITIYASVAWFEARNDPKAVGDCTDEARRVTIKCFGQDGRPMPGAVPHSFCLGQINDTNFAWLHVTKESLLGDVRVCLQAMSTMLHKSMASCRSLPFDDRLSWYASGGPTCVANVQGRHRMLKAKFLFSRFHSVP